MFQKRFFLVLCFAVLGMSSAFSVWAVYPGWLMDDRGNLVRNSVGECWRVGAFTTDTDRTACHATPPAMSSAKTVAPVKVEKPSMPIVKPDPVPVMVDLPERVQFAFDSSVLSEEAKLILDTVADELQAGTLRGKLQLVGHTCSLGSEAYNQALSERRAHAAADYLVGRGVSSTDLFISGKGESEPLKSNETDLGRRANRRVEIGHRR